MIYVILNRRGGTGKTTTAFALGSGLAKRGSKVLYVDMDSQCNLSYDIGAEQGRNSVTEVLTGSATAAEAVQSTAEGDIIPSSPSLAGADMFIDGTGKEYRLREALEPIVKDYNDIVIDTGPALNVASVNALTAAQRVIIPVQAEIHSLQGLALLQSTIEGVQKYTNPDLKISGILCTRYNSRAIISRDMMKNMERAAAELGTKVFGVRIRECVSLKESQAVKKNIYDYAPKSNAAQDYEAFVKEVLEDNI